MICILSVMLPYECPVFNMWLEYPDLLLLFFMSLICSLYLVLNGRSVCPMYFLLLLLCTKNRQVQNIHKKTHHNIIYVHFQVTNNMLYIL
jgi:hypothetical protein